MYRIDNTTAAAQLPTPSPAGTPGYWTDGDPQTGVEATLLSEDWFNCVQEELIYILTQAGVTPSKTNYTQVLTALRNMFCAGGRVLTISDEPDDRSDVQLDALNIGRLRLQYTIGADIHITHIEEGLPNQLLVITNFCDSGQAIYLDGVTDDGTNIQLANGATTRLWRNQSILLTYGPGLNYWFEISPTSAQKTLSIPCFAPGSTVTTGDAKGMILVGAELDHWIVTDVIAGVTTPGTTSGTTTVQLRRYRPGTGNRDLLGTPITLAVGEYFASDGVLATNTESLETGDMLYVDVDAVNGTPPAGLTVSVAVRSRFN